MNKRKEERERGEGKRGEELVKFSEKQRRASTGGAKEKKGQKVKRKKEEERGSNREVRIGDIRRDKEF